MLNKRYLPSITALQCFEAVTRHLSFTRAAEELNLTQSAVSKQVAQLEELLQHLLFRRVRRRLQMTPAGDLYLVEVRKILTQVEMSTHYLRSYGGETEVLRVSTPPTFGARWLVPRLKGWRLRHPSIHLDLCSEQEADDLLQGRSDLAFYFGQGSRPGTECLKLFGEELVPVCAPGSLPDTPFTDPTQLTDLVLLQNASRPQAWHDWFDSQGYHTEHSYHGPRFERSTCASAPRRLAVAWHCCHGFWWKKSWRTANWSYPGSTRCPAPTPITWRIRSTRRKCRRCAIL